MILTAEQRRALVIQADAGPSGRTEGIMAVHFTVDLLAGLVRQDGRACRPTLCALAAVLSRFVRMRITDAGRRALVSTKLLSEANA